MIPLVILIILTSGYAFIRFSPLARFRQSRLSGHVSYASIGMCGVPFTLLAGVVVIYSDHYLSAHGYYLYPVPNWDGGTVKEYLNEKNLALLSWAVLSHAIAIIFGLLKRVVNNEATAATKMASDDGLSRLILESMADSEPIQLTLGSRRVYIGIAFGKVGNDDFTKHEFIELIPFMSGYRDKDTLDLKLTCDYNKFYQKLAVLSEEERPAALASFKVIIPVSEVKSAAFFRDFAHDVIAPALPDDIVEETLASP